MALLVRFMGRKKARNEGTDDNRIHSRLLMNSWISLFCRARQWCLRRCRKWCRWVSSLGGFGGLLLKTKIWKLSYSYIPGVPHHHVPPPSHRILSNCPQEASTSGSHEVIDIEPKNRQHAQIRIKRNMVKKIVHKPFVRSTVRTNFQLVVTHSKFTAIRRLWNNSNQHAMFEMWRNHSKRLTVSLFSFSHWKQWISWFQWVKCFESRPEKSLENGSVPMQDLQTLPNYSRKDTVPCHHCSQSQIHKVWLLASWSVVRRRYEEDGGNDYLLLSKTQNGNHLGLITHFTQFLVFQELQVTDRLVAKTMEVDLAGSKWTPILLIIYYPFRLRCSFTAQKKVQNAILVHIKSNL